MARKLVLPVQSMVAFMTGNLLLDKGRRAPARDKRLGQDASTTRVCGQGLATGDTVSRYILYTLSGCPEQAFLL
ncbi:hypothetical protein GCM10011533_00890 [Streptosporangium jomthongense]|nr:hypothetical protein GCM10011533_00890 [Streptosporangium jomthongense]